jgi:Reverse transcriptase (RNA-dependent DNA polymerase)
VFLIKSLIDMHLTNYLKEFKVIDCRQFAYQKGKGVNQLLDDFSNHVNKNLSQKKHVLALFFDLSKAFDVLDHEILLKKLKSIGIRGKVLSLFESYLNLRQFCVKVDGKHSKFFHLNSGVPQGSILGPKLFLLYINDLFKHLKNVKILIFADDILILADDPNLETCILKLQDGANKLVEWAHDNALILNRKKTVGMHFCANTVRPSDSPKIKIHSIDCIHNFEIDCKCETAKFVQENNRYLGVYIDADMSWASHIKHLKNKLRSVIKEVKIAKGRLNANALRTIYFSLAYSHISYGISAWGNVNLTQIQNLQDKLLRIMSTKKQLQDHKDDVYKIWQVLPVKMTHELVVALLKYFDKEQGVRRIHSYQTRTAANEPLVMPMSQNKYHERTWEYIVPRIWNKIPQNLKSFNTHATAKEHIKNWFMSLVNDV